MGVQVDGRCYGNSADGIAALCSSVGFSVAPVSGGAQSVECSQVINGNQLQVKTGSLPNGGTAWTYTTKAYTPVMQPCSVLEWSDGLAIGWGIAAAWIVAAAVLFVSRASR